MSGRSNLCEKDFSDNHGGGRVFWEQKCCHAVLSLSTAGVEGSNGDFP